MLGGQNFFESKGVKFLGERVCQEILQATRGRARRWQAVNASSEDLPKEHPCDLQQCALAMGSHSRAHLSSGQPTSCRALGLTGRERHDCEAEVRRGRTPIEARWLYAPALPFHSRWESASLPELWCKPVLIDGSLELGLAYPPKGPPVRCGRRGCRRGARCPLFNSSGVNPVNLPSACWPCWAQQAEQWDTLMALWNPSHQRSGYPLLPPKVIATDRLPKAPSACCAGLSPDLVTKVPNAGFVTGAEKVSTHLGRALFRD